MLVRWGKKMYNLYFSREKGLAKLIYSITGSIPIDLSLYRLAFTHSSISDGRPYLQSNERLEYLGDSVLSLIVAEYLYNRYPFRAEGYLTEMRSRIVSRAKLNELGITLGFDNLLEFNRRSNNQNKTIYGNAVEAFIGAMYLDVGYAKTRWFIIKRLLNRYIKLDEIEEQNSNFKSQLLEYAQRFRLEPVVYYTVREETVGKIKFFTVACKVGNEVLGTGTDTRKKAAEQRASEQALKKLQENQPKSTKQTNRTET